MRPNQQNRRMRGRNNNNNNNGNRKGPNPLTRSYESNGPDVKIRGSAQQVAEKYTALARDAMSSGDRVMAENYLQHAEHYNRIIATAMAQMAPQRDVRDDEDDGDEDGNQRGGFEQRSQPSGDDGSGPQPVIDGVPAEVSMDDEQGSSQQGRRSRRNRRRENDNGADAAGDGDELAADASGDAPAAAADADEAPRRPRRPRRPRADEASAGDEDGVKAILSRGAPKQVAAVEE